MLPQMRYSTAKLSELVHKQKNYRNHICSVDKIMNKTNNQFVRRDHQLRQLKDRKQQSFSYTNYKRSKQIGHVNAILFGKIYSSSKIDKKFVSQQVQGQSTNFELLQEKIRQRDGSEEKEQKRSIERPFVLRNHRQSPIHKSTLLERTRENIRLAKKIVNPVITYRTQSFLKEHAYNKYQKERIMRYEPQFAKTKAQMYVSKKMSISWLSRKKSSSSFSNSSIDNSNPENSPKIASKSTRLGFKIQQSS